MLSREQALLLTEGARYLKVELSTEALASFSTYIEELLRWAKTVDLVSRPEPETIIRKHVLDSLAVLTILPLHGRLLDLGSGAGFPGLPLAIAQPPLTVTLLESRRKRANFLKEVIRKTRLANTQAYEGRAEDFISLDGWISTFDTVITRATWNIKEFLTIATPFVAKGGIIVTMKGPKAIEELKSLRKELNISGITVKTEHTYTLPYRNERRSIFVFETRSFT